MRHICACIIAFLLLQIPVFAQADLSHLSQDPQIVQARTLVAAGRHAEALELLRRLSPTPETKIDLLFLTGLAALHLSDNTEDEAEKIALLDEAIAALHEILVDRPGLMRVRLELARAFFSKGEDELSRRHFELVLAANPPAAIAANVNRFLQAIRKRDRWSGHFSISYLPKSNTDYDQDQNLVYLNYGGVLLPFRLDEDDDDDDGSAGMAVNAGLGYEFPVSKNKKFYLGADISRYEYPGGDSDSTSLSGRFGPRFLIGETASFSTYLTGGKRWTAGSSHSHHAGLSLSGSKRFGKQFTAGASASTTYYLYDENGDEDDGPSSGVSASFSYLFRPTIRGNLAGGFSRSRPKLERNHSRSRWARLGADFALPFGFSVSASGEVQRIFYNATDVSPDGSSIIEREDRRRALRLAVLNRGWTFQGFSPQLSFVRERNTSNTQRGGYRKFGWNLQFVRQF